MPEKITRRDMLAAAGGATICLWGGAGRLPAAEAETPFRISACDWSIGCGGQLSALKLGKKIGLDGVEVSFGAPGGKFDLRKPEYGLRKEPSTAELIAWMEALRDMSPAKNPIMEDRDTVLKASGVLAKSEDDLENVRNIIKGWKETK